MKNVVNQLIAANTFGNGSRQLLIKPLTFRYKTSDVINKTIIMDNLPTSPKKKGVVYVDGNNFLKISI